MKNRTILLAMTLLFIGAQFLNAQMDNMMHQKSNLKRAIAVITPTKGNFVHGIVTFEEVDKGVHVICESYGIDSGKTWISYS